MRLGWVRAHNAERCPDATTVARAVEARVGRPVFSADGAQSVEAMIQRTDGARWWVTIFLRDVDGSQLGTRTLSSEQPDCEAATSAAIFAIALAIDPESALRPLPATPTQSSLPAENAAPPPAQAAPALVLTAVAALTARAVEPRSQRPVVAPRVQPPPRELSSGAVSLGGWAAWGLVPHVALGTSLSGYVRVYRRFGLRGAMRWLPEQRTDTQLVGDVSFGLFGASLFADIELLGAERFALTIFGGATVSAIHAIVHDRPPVDTGERFAAGMSLGAHGTLQLWGPLELHGTVELASPLVRYRYRVEGPSSATVFEQPWLGAGATVALGARFR
jgi:hypothetical protein